MFLDENNLTLKYKKITGSYLKINWLKVIMGTTYGFESLPKDTYIFNETHKFVQEINNLKNCYLTSYEEEIYFHHLLLILNNPINILLTEEEQYILERIIVPPKLENSLKNFFNMHSKHNNTVLLNYSKLCFFLLSSHVFSPKIDTGYKDKVVSSLSKYAAVNTLFTKIEQEFDIRVNKNEIALNILYNHIKLHILNSQNLTQQNFTKKYRKQKVI